MIRLDDAASILDAGGIPTQCRPDPCASGNTRIPHWEDHLPDPECVEVRLAYAPRMRWVCDALRHFLT